MIFKLWDARAHGRTQVRRQVPERVTTSRVIFACEWSMQMSRSWVKYENAKRCALRDKNECDFVQNESKGAPPVINLQHVTSVKKKRKFEASARATACKPPKNQQRTDTDAQKRRAAIATEVEKAEVGNSNKIITKLLWSVEFTNQVCFKSFDRFSHRGNWQHLKNLDDDIKAIVVVHNLYRHPRCQLAMKGDLNEQDLHELGIFL